MKLLLSPHKTYTHKQLYIHVTSVSGQIQKCYIRGGRGKGRGYKGLSVKFRYNFKYFIYNLFRLRKLISFCKLRRREITGLLCPPPHPNPSQHTKSQQSHMSVTGFSRRAGNRRFSPCTKAYHAGCKFWIHFIFGTTLNVSTIETKRFLSSARKCSENAGYAVFRGSMPPDPPRCSNFSPYFNFISSYYATLGRTLCKQSCTHFFT